jgi:NAD(P)-dependent dehydrogenase (short-subunit alcohol dehydrogenase family)
MSSIISQFFPPKATWSVDQIPDLTGKVAIVTGACRPSSSYRCKLTNAWTGGNTGIGKETCKQLLIKNAKLYLFARSPDKAKQAIEELRQETGKEAIFIQMDLSDLMSVRNAAEQFLSCVISPSLRGSAHLWIGKSNS